MFRGFSRGETTKTRAAYKLLWHYDRLYDFILDTRRHTLYFPHLLSNVPRDMYRDLAAYLKSRQADDLPEHRRIDPARMGVRATHRQGSVSITLTCHDADYEHAARKAIHLVHELFLDFLSDGRYYDYKLVEFNLDPDRM